MHVPQAALSAFRPHRAAVYNSRPQASLKTPRRCFVPQEAYLFEECRAVSAIRCSLPAAAKAAPPLLSLRAHALISKQVCAEVPFQAQSFAL